MLFMMCIAMMTAEVDSDAIALAKDGKVACLSTDYKGTPFGSLAPYALDDKGNPVIYLSTLAVHTKNIEKKAECSVMVTKVDDSDLFNSARITLVGKMVKVPKEEKEKIAKAFFAKHEKAKEFAKFHDFDFYRMEIGKIYYIGGFGDIQWIDPKDYQQAFKK